VAAPKKSVIPADSVLDYATSEGRTPESEVRDILNDMRLRFPREADRIVKLWKLFEARDPTPDRATNEYLGRADFFARGRRVGGEDLGESIALAVRYCAQAKSAWHQGLPVDAWSYIAAAARWHGAACTLYLIAHHSDAEAGSVRSATGKSAAEAMHRNNPIAAAKQDAKKKIKDWWDEGRAIGPQIPSGAEFDRHAADSFPILAGAETVKRWRLAWGKKKR
jgi:hypothetical protein